MASFSGISYKTSKAGNLRAATTGSPHSDSTVGHGATGSSSTNGYRASGSLHNGGHVAGGGSYLNSGHTITIDTSDNASSYTSGYEASNISHGPIGITSNHRHSATGGCSTFSGESSAAIIVGDGNSHFGGSNSMILNRGNPDYWDLWLPPGKNFRELHELNLPLSILQLDPADRAVLRIADERDAVQKKTFTKWVNKHLMKGGQQILDLFIDLQDGRNLITLLEVLTHETLPRERGQMRFHKIQNVSTVLKFLTLKGIKYVNIRPDEIVNGNPKLTLGLVWTIILHFQISDVIVPGQTIASARDALILWSRRTLEVYPNIQIDDFSSSWRDGEAFLSIIHRHRPDLVDFARVRRQTARQNLSMAFNIAERELGVTRLLEPEDVDVAEPDEKCLITYVSSLYNVFPDVPSIQQTLLDNEKQMKLEEYYEAATCLINWINSSIFHMLDRNFPSTLVEIKLLLAAHNKFRADDLPQRLSEKEQLVHQYQELQELLSHSALSTEASSQLKLKPHLSVLHMNKLWDRLIFASKEREMAIQAEISRLERLQRLTEKIQYDCRSCEEHMDGIDTKIIQEENSLSKSSSVAQLHINCEALERAMKTVEQNLKSMFSDVQALKNGRYEHAEQLHSRVHTLHTRWTAMNHRLQTTIMSGLTSQPIDYPCEQIDLGDAARAAVAVEEIGQGALALGSAMSISEGSDAFHLAQWLISWINAKQVELAGMGYGTDLESCKDVKDYHKQLHKEIIDYKQQVDCAKECKIHLQPEDHKIYVKHLSKVELAYRQLQTMSHTRSQHLESLVDFMHCATIELMWLNAKEEIELSKDWSARDLVMQDIQKHQSSLMNELELREAQFNATQDKGEALVMDRHPAAKTIETYMAAMQTQWSWLLQLSVCLETHLKHACNYHQFYEECYRCEEFIIKQTALLNTQYNQASLVVGEGERLIRSIQELHVDIANYTHRIESLVACSRDVVPLKARCEMVQHPIKVTGLCAYKQLNMSIDKDEACTLLENDQTTKWRVHNTRGKEGLVPAVCILIPPPDPEAVQFVNKLRTECRDLYTLWTTRQRQLKLHMIYASIDVIQQWTLEQFQSLGPTQREVILSALNEDANKLLDDYSSDQTQDQANELRARIDQCNSLYKNLAARACDHDMLPSIGQQLTARMDSVRVKLDELDGQLQQWVIEPLPRDQQQLYVQVQHEKDFEGLLKQHDPEIEGIQKDYEQMSKQYRCGDVEVKVSKVLDQWEMLLNNTKTYSNRLQAMEVVLGSISELTHIVADYESTLLAHDIMHHTLPGIKQTHREIQDLDFKVQSVKPRIHQLQSDMLKLSRLVSTKRTGVIKSSHDLKELDQNIDVLEMRWDKLQAQLDDRLKNLKHGVDHLSSYNSSIEEETSWLCSKEREVKTFLPPACKHDAFATVDTVYKLYNEVKEKQYSVEAINSHGWKYIKEAKAYEKELSQYKSLLDVPVLDSTASGNKKPRIQSGASIIQTELKQFNKQYMQLLATLCQWLHHLKAVYQRKRMDFPYQVNEMMFQNLKQTFQSELYMDKECEAQANSPMTGSFPIVRHGADSGHKDESMDIDSSVHDMAETTATYTAIQQTTTSAHQKYTATADHILITSVVDTAIAGTAVLSSLPRNLATSGSNKQVQTIITMSSESTTPVYNILHHQAIKDPRTGNRLKLYDSIKAGLMDVQSMMYHDPVSGECMSVDRAVEQDFIDLELAQNLKKKSGMHDPVTAYELSLKEAIQAGYINTETGEVLDPRTGCIIPLDETVRLGILNQSAQEMLGFKQVTTTSTSQSCGFYCVMNAQDTNLSWTLSEAVQIGLINPHTGRFIDPVSKEEMSICEAMDRRLLDNNAKDIMHPITSELLSLEEAIEQHIIDTTAGCFTDLKSGKDISLAQALNTSLLKKPASLYCALTEGLIDSDGIVNEPKSGRKFTLRKAIEQGILDTNTKCIMDPRSDEMLSLSEAIKKGLINLSGEYVDPLSGHRLSIHDAVKEGFAQIISEDISLPPRPVNNTLLNKKQTLVEAISCGCLDTDRGVYVDSSTEQAMPLDEAVRHGLISKNVVDQLRSDSGLTDKNGKPFTVLEALEQNLLDPHTGHVINPLTDARMSLEEAIDVGIIDSEHAQKLLNLTSSIIFTRTIFINITPSNSLNNQVELNTHAIMHDALSYRSVDEKTEIFSDPVIHENMPITEAIAYGRLGLSRQWPDGCGGVEQSETPKSTTLDDIPTNGRLETTDSFVKDIADQHRLTAHTEHNSYTVEKTESGYKSAAVHEALLAHVENTKQIEISDDVPWPITIKSAVENGLLDTNNGLLHEPNTNKWLTIQQALAEDYLIGKSAVFVDPISSSKHHLNIAMENNLLNPQAQYKHSLTNQLMTLQQLVNDGIVVYNDKSVICETRSFVIDYVIHPDTGERLDTDEAIRRGILDIDKGTYTNHKTGEVMSLVDATENGFFVKGKEKHRQYEMGNLVKETKTFTITGAINPSTGARIAVQVACNEGIIDQTTGTYNGVDEQGNAISISISEAIRVGLLFTDESTSDMGHITKTAAQSDIKGQTHCVKETETVTIKKRDSHVGCKITVSEASKLDIMDRKNDMHVNSSTGEHMTINDSVKKSVILADIHSNTQPISMPGKEYHMDEALDKSLIKTEPNEPVMTKDPHGGSIDSLHIEDCGDVTGDMAAEAVEIETETFEITKVTDFSTGETIDFNKALLKGIIDESKGLYVNPKTGESMSIQVALNRGLIIGEVRCKDKHKVFESSVVAQQIPKNHHIVEVLNPMTNQYVPISQALQIDLINNVVTQHNDIIKHKQTPSDETVDKDLVKIEDKDKIGDDALDESVGTVKFNGCDATSKPDDNVLDFTIQKTRYADINVYGDVVEDTISVTCAPAAEAQQNFGLDPLSFEKTAKVRMVNLSTERYCDQVTGEEMSLDEAIRKGFIDPIAPALRDMTRTSISDALNKKQISPTVCISMATARGLNMTLDTQFSQLEGRRTPDNLADATLSVIQAPLQEDIDQGLINEESSLIIDPAIGEKLTLSETLAGSSIDGNTTESLNKKTSRVLSLTNTTGGMLESVHSPIAGEVYNPFGRNVLLEDALKKGTLLDGKTAIHDSTTGQRLTVKEAKKKCIIDSNTVGIDGIPGRRITVKDAGKLGLLAIVGAPVLAGMAAVEGAKTLTKMIKDQTEENKKTAKAEVRNVPEREVGIPWPGDKSKVQQPMIVSHNETQMKDDTDLVKAFRPIQHEEDSDSSTITQDATIIAKPTKITETVTAKVPLIKPKPIKSELSPVATENHHCDSGQQLVNQNLVQSACDDTSKTEYFTALPIQDMDVHMSTVDNTAEVHPYETSSPRSVEVEPLQQALMKADDAMNTGDIKHLGKVVDLRTEKQYTIQEALNMGLANIEWKTGRHTDTITREVSTPGEAVHRGLIDSHLADLVNSQVKPADQEQEFVTLNSALATGSIVIPLCRIKNPQTGEKLSIEESISSGYLDPNRSIIIDPATGKTMTLNLMIKQGIMDPCTGEVQNRVTGNLITFSEMCIEGLIPEHGLPLGNKMTLHEAIKCGYINLKDGTFIDPIGTVMDLDVAIALEYIEIADQENDSLLSTSLSNMTMRTTDISKDDIIPVQSGESMTFSEARKKRLIDNLGNFTDPLTGNVSSLSEAVKLGLLDVQSEDISGLEDSMTFKEALDQGFIDIKANTFKDPMTRVLMPLDAAIRRRLVTFTTDDKLSLIPKKTKCTAVVEKDSYFIDETILQLVKTTETTEDIVPRMSIGEAIQLNLYNASEGTVFDTAIRTHLTLQEALGAHIIDSYSATVRDNVTSENLDLETAMARGLLDCRGNLINHVTGTSISLKEALRIGKVQETSSKFIQKLKVIITETTNVRVDTIEHPTTQEELSLEEAIRLKVVNVDKGLYGIGKSQVSLRQAHEQGLILGQVLDVSITKEQIKIKATQQEENVTLLLAGAESLVRDEKALRDEQKEFYVTDTIDTTEDGTSEIPRFVILQDTMSVDSKTLKTIVADDAKEFAIESVYDPSAGTFISEEKARRKGLLTGGQYIDPLTGDVIPMDKALTEGLVKAGRQFISQNHGIKKVDVKHLKDLKMNTTLTITGVFDPNTNEELHPQEAIERGLFDKDCGLYIDPITGHSISTQEAYAKGLLMTANTDDDSDSYITMSLGTQPNMIKSVLDTSANERISVLDAVSRGCIDSDLKKFTDLANVCDMTIQQAIDRGYIEVSQHIPVPNPSKLLPGSQSCSIKSIIDPKTREEILIDDAIWHGIVDKRTGTYFRSDKNQAVTLSEAVNDGLVVVQPISCLHAKTLVMVDGLPETTIYHLKSVRDENTGEEYSPFEAEQHGLINKSKGMYNNPLTGKTMTIKDAIDAGLITAYLIEEPNYENLPTDISAYAIIEAMGKAEKISILHALDRKLDEKPVIEALRTGLIDHKNGDYIDPETGQRLSFSKAIAKGLLSGNIAIINRNVADETLHPIQQFSITGLVDPITGESLTVLQAIARGILDDTSGEYVNPNSGKRTSIADAVDQGLVKTGGVLKFDYRKNDDSRQFNVSTTRSFLPVSVQSTDSAEDPSIDSLVDEYIVPVINKYDETMLDSMSTTGPASGKLVRVLQGIDGHSQSKTYTDPDAEVHMSIKEAEAKGLLKSEASEKDGIIYEKALKRGIFDEECSLFRDPHTREIAIISEAINSGLLKSDNNEGSNEGSLDKTMLKPISMNKAAKNGLIDSKRNTFTDPKTGKTMPIQVAINSNFLVDTKKPRSAEDAEKQELIDLKNNAFTDPKSGRTTFIQEAVNKNLLKDSNKPPSFEEAGTEGLVDLKNNTLSDSKTIDVTSIHDAINKDILRDPEKPLRVEEAAKQGLVDVRNNTFADPKTVKVMSSKDAINKGPLADLNRPLSVQEPAKQELVDLKNNAFTDPKTGRTMFVEEAVSRASDNEALSDRQQTFLYTDAVEVSIVDPYTSMSIDPTTRESTALKVEVEGQVHKLNEELQQQRDWLTEAEEYLCQPSVASEDRDTLQQQLNKAKKCHKDLSAQEPLVMGLKKKAHKLITQKEYVDDMTAVRKQIKQLEKRWLGLMEVSENRCRSLEGMVEDLKYFNDRKEILGSWLKQKDRMAGLLGPLATDPVMLDNQLQQVQLLQEEITQQQSQYESLIKAAAGVLERADTNSLHAVKISDDLEDIERVWEKLSDKLHSRKQSLQDTLDLSCQYYNILQALTTCCQDYSDEMEHLLFVPQQPEAIQIQRDHVMTMKDIIQDKKPFIDKARVLCSQLCDLSKEASTKFDLKNKLASVEKPYADIIKKIDEKLRAIDSAVEAGEQFHMSMYEMLSWVLSKKDDLMALQPVSAIGDQLHQQQVNNEILQSEINSKERDLRLLLDTGRKMDSITTSTMPISYDISDLNLELEELSGEWKKLKQAAAGRKTKLDQAHKHAVTFHASYALLKAWLNLNKEKLDSIPPARLDKTALARDLKDAQALQGEVMRKSKDHEALNHEGEALISFSEQDQDVVARQLEDFNIVWRELEQGVRERVTGLEELSSHLYDYQDNYHDIGTSINKLNNKLDSHLQLGIDAKDLKHAEKIKHLQQELLSLEPQINYLRTSANHILSDTHRRCNNISNNSSGDFVGTLVPDVQEFNDTLSFVIHGYQDISDKVDNLLQHMHFGSQVIADLQVKLRDTTCTITELSNKLNHISSPGRDEQVIIRQLEHNEALLGELENIDQKIDDLVQDIEAMRNAGYQSDTDSMDKQIKDMTENMEEMKGLLSERGAELSFMKDALDMLFSDMRQINSDMDLLDQSLDDIADISSRGDANMVRQLQQDLKFFNQNKVHPVSHDLDAIMNKGQGLLQSAGPGVDTQHLESYLELLNGKWAKLKEKLLDHDRKLDVALLNSGKFQEGLGALLEWLQETEEMLSNQKPLSAEYKVLKAQVQEQKFLMRMLDDRRGSIKSVELTAADLVAGTIDQHGQQKIQDQIHDLNTRWEAMLHQAHQRQQDLNDMIQIAQEYHIKREPFLAFLDASEHAWTAIEPISTESHEIEEQLGRQKLLLQDILDHKPQLDDLLLTGAELLKHCTGEDIRSVQKHIDSDKACYTSLVDSHDRRMNDLEAALPLAVQFKHSHHQLLTWLQNIELELSPERESTGVEAEHNIQRFEESLTACRLVLEGLNQQGSQLASLSLRDGASKIDDMLSADNKQFEQAAHAIQCRAEKIKLQRQRSMKLLCEVDGLMEWFDDTQNCIHDSDLIFANAQHIEEQLFKHKELHDDISGQRSKARDLISAGKRLQRESSLVQSDHVITEKLDNLKEQAEHTGKQSSDRLTLLEQALPLAVFYQEAVTALQDWLDGIEEEIEEYKNKMPALNVQDIKQQQDQISELNQSINDQRPNVERMIKHGEALMSLMCDNEADKLHEQLDNYNKRYEDIKYVMRERSNSLNDALHQASQISEKLESVEDTLDYTVRQIEEAKPISAHPDKLRDQIDYNSALVEDLERRLDALHQVQNSADNLVNHPGIDPHAAQDLQQRIDDLQILYDKVKSESENRNKTLEETLGVSEQFWDNVTAVLDALKELEDNFTTTLEEPVPLEPASIMENQQALQNLRVELDEFRADIDHIHNGGDELIDLIGEPDKAEVRRNMEDVDNTWAGLNTQWANRQWALDDTLRKASSFQDELMTVLVWLANIDEKFTDLGPIATDIDTVKRQIEDLQKLTETVHPKQLDLETLKYKAEDLMKNSSTECVAVIMDPLLDVSARYQDLIIEMASRMGKLQNALVNLGQFQSAIDELLGFLARTEVAINRIPCEVYGDPKALEIELAKLNILEKDIKAHQVSVDSVNEAGTEFIASEGGVEAATTRDKLDEMNMCWRNVLALATDKNIHLSKALDKSESFHQNLKDAIIRLSHIDAQMSTTQPVGGLLETAKQQLEAFMALKDELNSLESKINSLLEEGYNLLQQSNELSSSHLDTQLHTLKTRWDNITVIAIDKQSKLEEAVHNADGFSTDLNDLIMWVTDMEKTLNNQKPVSCVLDHVNDQILEHQEVQKEITAQREQLSRLDGAATHLKYFNHKQDGILIKNLLLNTQNRWDKIISRSSDRTKQLDLGYKQAKIFQDQWIELIGWLDANMGQQEAQKNLASDPDKIKEQIQKHKAFQHQLGAKQMMFDSVSRSGRHLKEKCPKTDLPIIQTMLNEMKDKWNKLCSKSVDRQRKLDSSLLACGRLKDALTAQLDWLYKIEPSLDDTQPLLGDLDTVHNLIDRHKDLQHELGKRAGNVAMLNKAARDLIDDSEEDTSHLENQLLELTTRWEKVCKLSIKTEERLADALKQAEDFKQHSSTLLDWLGDVQTSVFKPGQLADEEPDLLKQIHEITKLQEALVSREGEMKACMDQGSDILRQCHPDAVNVVKNYMQALQTRWKEISDLAKRRNHKLTESHDEMKKADSLLDLLLMWITSAEESLKREEAKELPDNIPILEQLINDHHTFEQEMSHRQPDVERLTRTKKLPHANSTSILPTVGGWKSITGLRPRTPSHKNISEPEFKNPRVADLYGKWRNVWLMAMQRRLKLQDALDRLNERENMKSFRFDDWRHRYMRWMSHNKARVMDVFRRQDRDHDGKVTRKEFIDGIIASKFPTSRMEMEAVADRFDIDGDGYIDYKEFVATLRPDREYTPKEQAQEIHDEVKRQASKCTCSKQFRIHKIGEGKYRFGESQKLRLVRILRSTVMVRVGGGWQSLDEFLVKNDPCRAKGRTNIELREQFTLADGVLSQAMTRFVSKSPRSHTTSPDTNNSASSVTSATWSTGKTSSSTSGPITKIREKTQYPTPWKQSTRINADDERQVLPTGNMSTINIPENTDEHEVYTTMSTSTRNIAGRKDTVVNYQTHQTRTRSIPVRHAASQHQVNMSASTLKKPQKCPQHGC